MGEYAEMMLDGTCCCSCGEFLGDGDGFAVYCASCQPTENKQTKKIKPAKYKPQKIVSCLHVGCRKRFIDENAMKMHLRTFHIDKNALRQKQEKDKKLNAIRNAAPALLEALDDLLYGTFPDGVDDDGSGRIGFSDSCVKRYNKAKTAIKLARGE